MSSASQSGGRPRQADGREGGRQRQASARQRRLRGKSYEEQNAATDPSGDAGAAADAEQAAAPDCSVGEHHVMVEPEMHGLTTAEVEATLGWIDDAIPETSALLRAVEGCLTKFVWFGEDISRGALLEDPPAAFRSWREAAARQLQSASSMLELVQGRVRWLGDELSVFAEQFADVPEVHQQIADSIDRLNEQIESHNALASQLDELAPQVAVMDRGRPGWDPIWCQILGLALPGAATPAGGDGAGAIAGGAGSSGQAQTEGSSGQAQTEGSSGQAQTEGSSAAAGSTPRAPTPEEDEGILAQAQELASLSDAVRSVGEGVAVLTAFVRGGYGVRDAGAILRRLLTANSDLWGRFASLASSQPDQLAHVLERLGSITGTVVNTTAVLQIVSLLVQGKRAEASAELAQLGAGLGVGAACPLVGFVTAVMDLAEFFVPGIKEWPAYVMLRQMRPDVLAGDMARLGATLLEYWFTGDTEVFAELARALESFADNPGVRRLNDVLRRTPLGEAGEWWGQVIWNIRGRELARQIEAMDRELERAQGPLDQIYAGFDRVRDDPALLGALSAYFTERVLELKDGYAARLEQFAADITLIVDMIQRAPYNVHLFREPIVTAIRENRMRRVRWIYRNPDLPLHMAP